MAGLSDGCGFQEDSVFFCRGPTLGVLGADRPPGHFGVLGSGLYGFCFRVRLLGAITGGFSVEMVFTVVSEVRLVWRSSA